MSLNISVKDIQAPTVSRYFIYLKDGQIAKTIFIDHPILSFFSLILAYFILRQCGVKLSTLFSMGGKLIQIHRRINAFVLEFQKPLTSGEIMWLEEHLHIDIEPVTTVKACNNIAVTQTGVDKVRNEYQGKGIKVAVIDTGICDKHPALKGRVIAKKNFVNPFFSFTEFIRQPFRNPFDSNVTIDDVGHGSHCAGSVGGNGPVYTGVAPKVSFIDAKVLGANGSGSTDQVVRGMSWAADQGADVISMSLGGPGTPNDAISREANLLAREGIVVVCAAGNEGPTLKTIGSPGCASDVITVGAVDQQNKLTFYSSRGPVIDNKGQDLGKPDILAPGGGVTPQQACNYGTGITSVKSLDIKNDPCVVTDSTGALYIKMSGTSMATPHVAGICALLIEASGLTRKTTNRCEIIKNVIKKTAKNLSYIPDEQGVGLINAEAAIATIKKLGEVHV